MAAGFRVLAIDFRGRGLSRGGPGSSDERYDGGSFGGWAASQAAVASDPDDVERLVLLGAEADTPEKLRTRTLFIVARDDANDAGRRLPRIEAQYDRVPGPKELVVLDGSAHAQFLFASAQGERTLKEILRFLTAP